MISIVVLLFIVACLLRLAYYQYCKKMSPQPTNFIQSPCSAKEQTIVLAGLPHDLLCETARQFALEGTANVILAVPETWRGKIAKASIERDIRTYNTWLVSQGLDTQGLDDTGRIVTKFIVKQLGPLDVSSAQTFARELGSEIDSIDVLVIDDSDNAVQWHDTDHLCPDEEKRSLIRNGSLDIEKGSFAQDCCEAVAVLIYSLAPKLQKAAMQSGQSSHVSLVCSRTCKASGALDWLYSSVPWNRRHTAIKGHARHQKQQRRLDAILRQLTSISAHPTSDTKLPGALSSWSQKDVLVGLHFSSIDASTAVMQQFFPSKSYNEAAAGQIKSVISKRLPTTRA